MDSGLAATEVILQGFAQQALENLDFDNRILFLFLFTPGLVLGKDKFRRRVNVPDSCN